MYAVMMVFSTKDSYIIGFVLEWYLAFFWRFKEMPTFLKSALLSSSAIHKGLEENMIDSLDTKRAESKNTLCCKMVNACYQTTYLKATETLLTFLVLAGMCKPKWSISVLNLSRLTTLISHLWRLFYLWYRNC